MLLRVRNTMIRACSKLRKGQAVGSTQQPHLCVALHGITVLASRKCCVHHQHGTS